MHRDDQMTPKERMQAFAAGKPMDRYPVMPFAGTVSAKFAGMTQRERRSSARTMAEAQIAAYRRLGHDSISLSYGLHAMGFAMGSSYNDPEDAVPAIMEHVLKNLGELDRLDFDRALPDRDAGLKKTLDACELLQEALGNECGIGFGLTGPFTAAASIYRTDDVLRAMKKNPQALHRLLRKCTDTTKLIADECDKRGLGLSIADPVASGTILRPKQYDEFVAPYTKDLIGHIHTMGKAVSYHVCGQTAGILENMVQTGNDIMSLDNVVDLFCAKTVIGAKVCIAGNVDPVGVLMLGTPEQIDKAVRRNYQDMYDSPKGYILASGCDIPSGAPLENLDMFMAAARKYGQWPIDPERLAGEALITNSFGG